MAEEKKENQEASPEEEEEEKCPECPAKGAPAWMATFADMATLLMAFFVLILSFAEFNVPKFKQISGSMKNAFGIQRVIPVVEQPKGTTILSLNFSPNPTPKFFDLNQLFEIEEIKFEILFVPGHSPGHVAFYNQENNFLINGDCLFENSIGRTDLPGGNHQQLINSIKNEIFQLPDETLVYCGHGNETTIKAEKSSNPFLY